MSRADSGTERDDGRDLRQMVLFWMRNPRSTVVEWDKMPRGLGDDYTALDDGKPLPTSFLSLTQIQYALLDQWAKGQFESDWPGAEPDIPASAAITPQGLDQAALENSIGGPFYPGIETSWLVRRHELYLEPLRFRIAPAPDAELRADDALTIGALRFGPGFFTQQMALPWQADFYDCHKEQHENPELKQFWYMWWTAQRPDDVYPAGATEQKRWVRDFDAASTTDDPDSLDNLARFSQMQQNWSKLRFLIRAKQPTNHKFEEES